MAHVAWAVLVASAAVVITFLPFVTGGYDQLAVLLATIAWVAGRVGLVLVPIGLVWARRGTLRTGWSGSRSVRGDSSS